MTNRKASHPWGLPVWQAEVDLPAAPFPVNAEVLVVGAGLTGLSVAYHLRRVRPGWTIAVLEAGRVGDGASGRNGGILLDGTAVGPDPRFDGCLDDAVALIERERIECALERHGCWEIAHGEGGAEAMLNWKDAGLEIRIARTIPGGTVDPSQLVAGLARAAWSTGAIVVEGCSVTALSFDPHPRAMTARGPVTADWIVLASNAYALDLGELRATASPFLAVAIATAPLGEGALEELGLASRQPFYTIDLPYLWGRVTPCGALVLGTGRLAPERGDVMAASIDSPEGHAMIDALVGRAHLLHPALAEVPITHRWAGPILMPEGLRPVLREHPRSPRVLIAGGYAGHGVAQSLRMGALVADRVLAA